MLDLVRQQDPTIHALVGFDDWLYPETIELLNNTSNRTQIAATIWHAEFYTSWRNGKPEKLPDNTVWFEAVKNSRVAPYSKTQGFTGCFLGLRAEEAGYRKIHLSKRGEIFFCKLHQAIECNPLAFWTVEDVWAYLLSRKVNYNRSYDKLTDLGIPLQYQRVGPMAVDKVLGYGQLSHLKRGWPEFYNQFIREFPEASGYS